MLSRPPLDDLLGARGRMAGRYVAVSAFNFAGHQILLYIANSVWGWEGGWANMFAACVMAGPAYVLSRTWVWELDGKHDFQRHVLPFWAIAIAGLALSTLLAAVADAAFGAGLAVNVASLVGYFVIWVAKFFLLDRVFVSPPSTGADRTDATDGAPEVRRP